MRNERRVARRLTTIAAILLLAACGRTTPAVVGPPRPLWAPDASLAERLDVADYLTDEYLLRAPRSACVSGVRVPEPLLTMRVVVAELPDGSVVRVWPLRGGRGEITAVELDRVWPGRGGVRISDRHVGPGELWALRYAGRPHERRDEATQRSRDPADLAALRSLGARVFALACPPLLSPPSWGLLRANRGIEPRGSTPTLRQAQGRLLRAGQATGHEGEAGTGQPPASPSGRTARHALRYPLFSGGCRGRLESSGARAVQP